MYGYIYIRCHQQYDIFNACKLGKTLNIPDRESQYIVGEIKRGYFKAVFEVNGKILGHLEISLKNEFKKYNVRYDGGTEFFDKTIIDLIEPYLISHRIDYRKLMSDEITELTHKVRKESNNNNLIIPREYQTEIIEKSITFFQQNNKGIILMVCGSGKTLISLWIANAMKCNKILIGVPNTLLIHQWKTSIKKVMPNINIFLLFGTKTTNDLLEFTDKNTEHIIITTYASSYKVKESGLDFDIKIFDEVHHLTSKDNSESQRRNIQILDVPSKLQLSLTATLKTIQKNTNNDYIISNDNKEIFGDIITKKSLVWGIQNNIVCDYYIQTIISDIDVSEYYSVDSDKSLAISAYCSLLSLKEGHTHHILIYTNSIENAIKIVEILTDMNKIYFDDNNKPYIGTYDSEMTREEQANTLESFESNRMGILSCVYCLGEGWDLPLLDGVVFAENMTSNIRIFQSSLRASRKDPLNLNKITKIIIPVFDIYNDNSNDMKRIKKIVKEMGIEDEMISEKLKVYTINNNSNITIKHEKNIIEYDDNLTLDLRLRTITRQVFGVSYKKAKDIVAGYKLESKEEYMKICDKDCRLTKEPQIIYKEYFTNWVDYLGIKRVYYDLERCRERIKELKINTSIFMSVYELSVYCKECDSQFPPLGLWTDYYGINTIDDIICLENKNELLEEII